MHNKIIKQNYLINLLRLMRLDKPHGTILLLIPTLQALFIAGRNNYQSLSSVLMYMILGTVVMRTAGCVINDIADRRFDRFVARTQNRPLTVGVINISSAWIWTILLLISALYIVLQLPLNCFICAVPALLMTIIYPLCKRFFKAPQMMLGLTFSMGIPIAFFAVEASLDKTFYVLFLINFLWIVSYDTMYALEDKNDDIKLKLKSTAIYFGKYAQLIINFLNVVTHILWLYLAYIIDLGYVFFICWLLASTVLWYQKVLLKQNKFLEAFKASIWYGMVLMVGLLSFVLKSL